MQNASPDATFSGQPPDWPRPEPDQAGLVSVVLRTRERPLLLRRALAAVLAQTCGRWRLILVNDGGPAPELEALLAPYRQLFGERLLVVHNPVCLGRAGAANLGLKAATGEFAALLDDDDTWSPEFLEQLTAYLATPGHEPLVGAVCRTRLVSERIENGAVLFEGEAEPQGALCAVHLDRLLAEDHIPLSSLVFRRAALEGLKGFDQNMGTLADWEFLTRLAGLAEIGVLPGTLANRHRRTNFQGTPYANGCDSPLRPGEEALARNQALRRSLARTPGSGSLLDPGVRLLALPAEVAALRRQLADLRQVAAGLPDPQRIEAGLQTLERVEAGLEPQGAALARLEGRLDALEARLEATGQTALECVHLLERERALAEDLAAKTEHRLALALESQTQLRELHLWAGILTWPLRAVWRPLRRAWLGLVGQGGGHAA